MVLVYKLTAMMLIATIIIMHFPKESCAQDSLEPSATKIKIHEIEIRSTPDEPLAIIETKKSKWWLWGLLGAAVVGGAIALAGGDSGSGGDTGNETTTPITGSATVSW